MKRRLTCLLLALILLLGMLPSVCAASDEAQTAADALHTLGLFNGTGSNADGTPIYDLDRTPTRHEAVTMLVRLLGKESDAKYGKWELPFTDVDAWAKPYVGYAYANGLTAGTGAATYSGGASVTSAQYITFVLRALGYTSGVDFEWDRAWELSDEIGLTDGRYDASTTVFTRGDVALISYRALSLCLKDTDTPLSATLTASRTLDGYWHINHETDVSFIEEVRYYSGNTYASATICTLKDTGLYYYSYEEGTFSITNGVMDYTELSVSYYYFADGKTTYSEIARSGRFDFTWNETSFAVSSYSELPAWTYDCAEVYPDAEKLFHEIKDFIDEKVPKTTQPNQPTGSTTGASDHASLAAADFRAIRAAYSEATPNCAYVYEYTNANGEQVVLVYVSYKIITNWNKLILHNRTTGATIEDPAKYYDKQADRAWGASRSQYLTLENEVLSNQQQMLKAMVSILKGQGNTFGGTYVDAQTLAQ